MKKITNYFTKFEISLWCLSVLSLILSYIIFEQTNLMTLIASLIGITSLIFIAKGNPIGQLIMIFFSITYGVISYQCAYYGEMITYLGMSMPMAFFSLISWLKNPYKNKKSEVKINTITKKECMFMFALSVVVTVLFYFILKTFGTAKLIVSTFSITTSFIAVYLTFRRNPYFAFTYALNDIVLIVLWVLASIKDIQYISVVVCFVVFFANDIYSFINWQRMKKRQSNGI